MAQVHSFNKNVNSKDRFAFLIKKHCSLEIYNYKKVGKAAAITMAIISNQTGILKKLLNEGISPNLKLEGTAPIFCAIMHQRMDALRILLEKGANPNVKSIVGSSPLHYSAEYISADISKLLINFGADPKIKDLRGRTPLIIAVRRASLQNVNLLLNYTDVNTRCKDNKSALANASLNPYKISRMDLIIDVLLKAGAQWDYQDNLPDFNTDITTNQIHNNVANCF